MMIAPDAIALGKGLLIGDDSDFSQSFKDLVKLSGVSHLVAASGSNIAFVEALAVSWMANMSRSVKSIITFLTVCYYFWLVGESGSLWRATVMWIYQIVFAYLGFSPGKSIVWSLIFVATFLLQRKYLTSASFILSFLAIVSLHFSRFFVSGEANMSFFPQYQKMLYYCKNAYIQGSCVLVGVSLWLFPQYRVFQPIGIITTFLLQPIIHPYTWMGLLQEGYRALFEPLEKRLWFIPLLQSIISFIEQSLFLYVNFVLESIRVLVSSPQGNFRITLFLSSLSLFMLFHSLITKYQNKQERNRWVFSLEDNNILHSLSHSRL